MYCDLFGFDVASYIQKESKVEVFNYAKRGEFLLNEQARRHLLTLFRHKLLITILSRDPRYQTE